MPIGKFIKTKRIKSFCLINIVVVNSEYMLNLHPSEIVNKSNHQLQYPVRYSYNAWDLHLANYY